MDEIDRSTLGHPVNCNLTLENYQTPQHFPTISLHSRLEHSQFTVHNSPFKTAMSELAKKLIENEKRERTGTLDLGNCGLTKLPKELFELEWLIDLNLRDEPWFPFEKNDKPRYQEKREGQNLIKSLPKEFSKLINLEKLDFGGPNVLDNEWEIKSIKPLSNLKKIKHLIINSNFIEDLNPISELVELEELDISYNSVKNLEPITRLRTCLKIYFAEGAILERIMEQFIRSSQVSELSTVFS